MKIKRILFVIALFALCIIGVIAYRKQGEREKQINYDYAVELTKSVCSKYGLENISIVDVEEPKTKNSNTYYYYIKCPDITEDDYEVMLKIIVEIEEKAFNYLPLGFVKESYKYEVVCDTYHDYYYIEYEGEKIFSQGEDPYPATTRTASENFSYYSGSDEDSTNAKICAVEVVENHLKAPSTAKFCTYPEMTSTSLGGNQWKVTGYVDAENSYGATVREYFTVTLTLTRSGYKDASIEFD